MNPKGSASEEQYRFAFEYSPCAMLMVNGAGLIEMVNIAAERLFGYDRNELLGQPIEILVPQSFRDGHQALRASFQSNPQPRSLGVGREFWAVRKDGTEFPAEIGLTPIQTEDGVAVLTAVIDISARRASEQTQLQYEAIVESSNDAIIGKTLDGIITSWNSGAERIFGFSRDEAMGQSISIIVPKEYADEEKGLLESLRSGIFVKHHETVRRRNDGQLLDVSLSISPIRDQNGKVVGAAIILRKLGEESQRENQELLNAIVKLLPLGLWVLDPEGKILFANDAAEKIWGDIRYGGMKQRGEYKGWRHDNGLPIAARQWPGVRAVEKGEASFEEEIEIEAFDGTRKIILDSAVPLIRQDGSIRGAVTINQDITERKKIERELWERSAILQVFASAAPTAVAMFDREMRYLVATRQWNEHLGLGDRDIVGLSHYHVLPNIPERWRESHRRCLAGGGVERCDEDTFLRPDGTVTWVRWELKPWNYPDGKVGGLIMWSQDITAFKQMHDEVKSLAFYDHLTSLPNRRLLSERLKVALAASRRSGKLCAVLLIDLDHFKQVNDTLGHHAGDSLLQQVARRLPSCLRESDIVGRWGGDEFVVVLENLHERPEEASPQIARIGKTIIAQLNKSYTLAEQEYSGTVSIGAALCLKKVEDEEEVFKRADKALYLAKAGGRNKLCFGEP